MYLGVCYPFMTVLPKRPAVMAYNGLFYCACISEVGHHRALLLDCRSSQAILFVMLPNGNKPEVEKQYVG
jgi:hypothetical protein